MTDVHFTAGKERQGHSPFQDLITPPEFYASLDAEFHFDFDPCPVNPTFDGLQVEWGKSSYVNPPFKGCKNWVKKAHSEWKKGKTVVMLVPSSTSTEWFHLYVYNQAEIRFVRGRIRFINPKTMKPFPVGLPMSMMVVVFKA